MNRRGVGGSLDPHLRVQTGEKLLELNLVLQHGDPTLLGLDPPVRESFHRFNILNFRFPGHSSSVASNERPIQIGVDIANVIPLPASTHGSGNAVTGQFQNLSRRREILSFVPDVLEHTAPDAVGGFDHLPTDPVAVFVRLADPQRRRTGTEVFLHETTRSPLQTSLNAEGAKPQYNRDRT